ncbi:MAG: hypothetical protein AAF993_20115 [Pseudomonadota bacterium]
MTNTWHNILLEVAARTVTSGAARSVQNVDLCVLVDRLQARVQQSLGMALIHSSSMNHVTHPVKGFAYGGGGSSG